MPSKPTRKPATKKAPAIVAKKTPAKKVPAPVPPAKKTPAKHNFIDLTTSGEHILTEPEYWNKFPGSETGKVLINRADLEKFVRRAAQAQISADKALFLKLENASGFTELGNVTEQLDVIVTESDKLDQFTGDLYDSVHELQTILSEFKEIRESGIHYGLGTFHDDQALSTFKATLSNLACVLVKLSETIYLVESKSSELVNSIGSAMVLTCQLVEVAGLSDVIDTTDLE